MSYVKIKRDSLNDKVSEYTPPDRSDIAFDFVFSFETENCIC